MAFKKHIVWTNKDLLEDLESKGFDLYKPKASTKDTIISCLMAIGLVLIPILVFLVCVYSANTGV